ncbi:hypothetical protein OIU83_02950 [Flavobacterium sp. LS1R49]|uniref:YD repeat-containing protein n=1 Tax=Flavobacterium shii TaxID=2987687 RepID=A0A9X3BXK0_9FLAO|nr:hypothetical protein [Flavobacterium shii]MCV9926591.1 hypothetical protein [Flavobacterium shii]
MKKLLYLFLTSLLTLASCSSDNDNSSSVPSEDTSILPKTTTSIYSEGNRSISTNTYEGNKILSVTSKDRRVDFIYDGDVIVKENQYNTENGKDIKEVVTTYTYANGKLATVLHAYNFTIHSSEEKFELIKDIYTYNADGSINIESYYTDVNGIEDKDSFGAKVLTFENGNLTKSVSINREIGKVISSELYEYDTKSNPKKYILGFNLRVYGTTASINNVVKRTFFSTDNSSIDYKTSYEYNADGFPIKVISYNSDGTGAGVIEYTY